MSWNYWFGEHQIPEPPHIIDPPDVQGPKPIVVPETTNTTPLPLPLQNSDQMAAAIEGAHKLFQTLSTDQLLDIAESMVAKLHTLPVIFRSGMSEATIARSERFKYNLLIEILRCTKFTDKLLMWGLVEALVVGHGDAPDEVYDLHVKEEPKIVTSI